MRKFETVAEGTIEGPGDVTPETLRRTFNERVPPLPNGQAARMIISGPCHEGMPQVVMYDPKAHALVMYCGICAEPSLTLVFEEKPQAKENQSS